ncbi:MAG: LLM class flavin-dependent oxidoreductase [Acidimicrobiia bacterium]|nr:LLM class flavin-dependent oxidoreductase [Acidimicrobiia bacterium]
MLTCTWAPTATTGLDLANTGVRGKLGRRSGRDLVGRLERPVRRAEELGVDHLLVAQRWWGTGAEIEGSSYDCLAMTAWYASITERIGLITAIHPGFFLPAPIAKWAATIDRLTEGRWAINLTTGWHLQEFAMFGVDEPGHDRRYDRSREFLDVLRLAWTGEQVDYAGEFYRVDGLRIDPPPWSPALTVFQGGQSDAARDLAATHSDWMFLNGGPLDKLAGIIEDVRSRASAAGRTVRFAVYGIPCCRATDQEAWAAVDAMVEAVDPSLLAARRERVSGAQGMWQPSDDALTALDSNEGYATRLIGSPDSILRRLSSLRSIGVELVHLALGDPLFETEVLPHISQL